MDFAYTHEQAAFRHEVRREQRAARSPWLALPTKNTLDRATAVLPKLLRERMDEFGLDFPVPYLSLGLGFPHIENTACRRRMG